MQPMSEEEIEARAREIVAAYGRPRRRERRRIAEGLRDSVQHAIKAPDGDVAAWRAGEGPAVLLVHGWEDDNSLWTPLIARLRAHGRAVVALDLPGHGLSVADSPAIPNIAAAIRAVADALGPVDAIVAHSMGVSGALYALDHGLAVRAAVLIAPPLPTRPELVRRRRSWSRPDMPEALAARIKQLLDERAARAPQFDPEAVAARIKTRALFVHCKDDEMWPPESSQHIAAKLEGAELHLTTGLGHRPVARDATVIERVVAFLDEPA